MNGGHPLDDDQLQCIKDCLKGFSGMQIGQVLDFTHWCIETALNENLQVNHKFPVHTNSDECLSISAHEGDANHNISDADKCDQSISHQDMAEEDGGERL